MKLNNSICITFCLWVLCACLGFNVHAQIDTKGIPADPQVPHFVELKAIGNGTLSGTVDVTINGVSQPQTIVTGQTYNFPHGVSLQLTAQPADGASVSRITKQGAGVETQEEEISFVESDGSYNCSVLLDQNLVIRAYFTQKAIVQDGTDVYANGTPVTVVPSTNTEGNVRVYATDNPEDYVELSGASASIYGGSKEKSVVNTSVTIDGAVVRNVFGGGLSTNNTASSDVSGTAIIKVINGGRVTNMLVGGGYYYAKTNATSITVEGTSSYVNWLLAGGYDAGQTGNTIDTTLDDSNNGVKNVSITIGAGAEIELLGTGGGQGYTRTGTSTVQVNDATIHNLYGTLSNGRADKIEVKVTNATIGYADKAYELAAINRGMVGEATFTFEGCSFLNTNQAIASLSAVEGWADSDTNGNPVPTITDKVVWIFQNSKTSTPTMLVGRGTESATIELTGATALMNSFQNGAAVSENTTTYRISEGKTWTFHKGLEMESDVSLIQSGSLTVSGTMKVATAEQATQAIMHRNAGIIEVEASSSALLAELNKQEAKQPLSAGIHVSCSDQPYIYTDNASALAHIANKAKVIVLEENTYKLADPKPIEITIKADELKATDVEVGKRLVTSILSGGYAVKKTESETDKIVTGTFAWKKPETEVEKEGENSYTVIFTPTDLQYATAEVEVTVNAIQYYTVVTGTSQNGKVEITNSNAANKYQKNAVLNLKYTPDVHYQRAGDQPDTHTVTKDETITGEFTPIQHVVTIASVTNGSLKVINGATEVKDGEKVNEGTLLNVTAIPAEGYKLSTLTNGTTPIRNNSISVDAALNIQATFVQLPATEFTVSTSEMKNGKLLLLDANGNSINKGASVKSGTKLTVVAIPDKGYELDGDIKVGDTKVTSPYTVSANTTFSAAFKLVSYEIKKSTANVSITVKKGESEVTTASMGDELTVDATPATGYKLLSLVVNGKEIPNEGSFTVTDQPNIVANVVEKTKIQFNDLTQTVVYDGTEKQFVVRSIPAGLTGFTVKYDGSDVLPVNSANNDKKEYIVTIIRAEDSEYAAVSQAAKLIIEAAPAKGFAVPTWDGSTWTGSGAGSYTEETKEGDGFRNVTFTPEDTNMKPVVFSVAKNTSGLTQVSLDNAGLRSSFSLRAGEEAALSITSSGGSVTLWNGTEQITGSSIVYVGQTLTVKGLPNAGKSNHVNWTINGTASTGKEATITLRNSSNTIIANFIDKTIPTLPTLSPATYIYSGSALMPEVETGALTGWNILVKAGELVIDNPTDAGTYTVYVTRDEDEEYAAVNQSIGTYEIKPQGLTSAVLSVMSATAILKGQALSASELTGSAPVAGTFTWAAPATIAEGASAEATESNPYPVVFTSANPNYVVASSVALTQTVPFYAVSADAIRTITITQNNANGTVVVKVNGTEVSNGTQVTEGDQIEVTATPNAGYNYSISTTGITNGRVNASGEVKVSVTFSAIYVPGEEEPDPNPGTPDTPATPDTPSTPDTPTDPSGPTDVVKILFDTTEKTLERGSTFELNVTVTGIFANQLVWVSSDDNVVTVKDGKITAVGIGKATVTARYSDIVASCEIKVVSPTSIESIAEGSRIYSVGGNIVVVPSCEMKVAVYSVNGACLFVDEVSAIRYIPVTAGYYLIACTVGDETVTERIIVH
ncbi:MAG: hypothetical protein SPD54_11965 [Parabacteroides sp.]|nr:hypothetical protein [Parabacteroides sp.]